MNILLSYHFLSKTPDIYAYASVPGADVLLDSGAYSAKNSGAVIDQSAYIEFRKRNAAGIWGAIQLDVIGDRFASLVNLDKELAAGLQSLAVFTQDAPISHMKELADRTSRVCIAGGVTETAKRNVSRSSIVKDAYPDMTHHCLGITRDFGLLANSTLDSFDSSSWFMTPRFGVVSFLQDAKLKNIHRLKFQHAKRMADLPKPVSDLLMACRNIKKPFAPREFKTDRTFWNLGSITAYLRLCSWMGKRGKRMFLAAATVSPVCLLGAACASILPGRGLDYALALRYFADFDKAKLPGKRAMFAAAIKRMEDVCGK